MHEKKEDVFPHLGEIVFLQLPLLSPTVSPTPAPASILDRSPRLLLCCPDTGPGTSAAHGDRSPGNSAAGAAEEAAAAAASGAGDSERRTGGQRTSGPRGGEVENCTGAGAAGSVPGLEQLNSAELSDAVLAVLVLRSSPLWPPRGPHSCRASQYISFYSLFANIQQGHENTP